MEATQEIARQLRLRDMAGLVVIDFIDMEQNSHVRKVEKAMKEALKNDRARIQVGRISSFGLMEMSRQRLRTGVLEASTKACPHCDGTGLMRTASSAGLSALRMIEDEAARGRGDRVCLRAGAEAAIYVLNKKRAELADIEARYGVSVEVLVDHSFEGARMAVESSGPRPVAPVRQLAPPPQYVDDEPEIDEEELAEEFAEDEIEERESPRRSRDEEGDDRMVPAAAAAAGVAATAAAMAKARAKPARTRRTIPRSRPKATSSRSRPRATRRRTPRTTPVARKAASGVVAVVAAAGVAVAVPTKKPGARKARKPATRISSPSRAKHRWSSRSRARIRRPSRSKPLPSRSRSQSRSPRRSPRPVAVRAPARPMRSLPRPMLRRPR